MSDDDSMIIAMNFVPVERKEFVINVKEEGEYECFVNSENEEYGGTWTQNMIRFKSKDKKISVTLPSYGALFIRKRG